MKRPPLKRGKPLQAKKRINPASGKRRAYRASETGKLASLYMGLVKQLPCVICGEMGVDAHHVICDRYGARKSSDFDVIPLAPLYHRADFPTGIHAGKETWREIWGADWLYIPATRAAVLAMVDDDTRRRLQAAFDEADKN